VKERRPGGTVSYVIAVDDQKCPVGQIEAMNGSPWETYGMGLPRTY
jgi:hypothetical protein